MSRKRKMASITSAGLVFAMLLSQSAVADLGTEQVKAAENTAKWVDTEYVVNGDFESSINGDGSITGWTKSTGSGLFVTKDEWAKNNTTQFTKIKDITGDNSLSQTIKNVEPGTYRISIDQDGQKDVKSGLYVKYLEQAKELLEKALGNDKAQGVIAKLTASLQVRPFEFIRKTDPAQLLNFIQDEHPQTIAMILSYLAPAQASQVLGALPPEKQADVAKRIATMDRTSPDVIKEVERVLERKLASLVNQDYTIVGGIDAIVGILNSVDRGTEKHIMESLEIEEPELADEIRKKMFVFEDILLLDDRAIQRVLRDVENADLELALKNTTEEVQNVIYKNLSKRLAAMIKEDMDFMGPVRMKDVEEAQQKIVAVIRKLEDAGEIVISRGGGDDIVV